jgi:virulence factor Mce-like protein
MRRRGPNRLTLALVGIAIIAVGVLFVFTKRIPFLHGYRLNADFKSSNQLVPGFSPVRIAGVTVGKVSGIDKGPGGTSEVRMELKDSALPIHADARVRIRPRLFLEGGFFVELDPGSPSARRLASDATLPKEQTADPVQLHQILTAFDQSTLGDLRSVIKELDKGLDNGGAKGLGRAIVAFGPVLRDTAQLSEAARGDHPHDVSEGIASTAKITSALADNESDLRGLVTNFNTTMTTLASRDTQVADTVTQLDRLIRETPRSLDALNAVQPVFRRFIKELRPSLRISPPILDDTVKTLAQLRGLTAPKELPAAIKALKPTVRNLPGLETQLNRLFPLVTPVNDCLRTRVAPILASKLDDGALSTNLQVWQELAQAGVGIVGYAQNFDGNGYWSRYLSGAGESAISTGLTPSLDTLVGSVTGAAERLVGSTSQPITGQRPTYLGPNAGVPPTRPDAPCTDQELADLTQRTGGGTPMAASPGGVAPGMLLDSVLPLLPPILRPLTSAVTP